MDKHLTSKIKSLISQFTSDLQTQYLSNVDKFLSSLISEQNIKQRTLTKDEMKVIWTSIDTTQSIPAQSVDSAQLTSMKIPELKDLCRTHSLKISGNKQDLISRLTERLKQPAPEIVDLTQKPPEDTKDQKSPSRQDQLVQNPDAYVIEKNEWKNFAHKKTGLVFDKTSKKCIGKQNSDGTIEPLNETTIELCRQYHFQYEKEEGEKELEVSDDDSEIYEVEEED